MAEVGTRRRRHRSRREKEKLAGKIRIGLVVVAMWLATVAVVLIVVEASNDGTAVEGLPGGQ